MRLEVFHILDNQSKDDSIMKRYFGKLIINRGQIKTNLIKASKNIDKISCKNWYNDGKVINVRSEFHVDKGSAQNIKIFDYVMAAHQSLARFGVPNKTSNIAFFDNLDVRKYFVEISGQRYPKDAVNINYTEDDCLDQYRDLKLFYKEYSGEEFLYLLLKFVLMKNFYLIQIIDLRCQVDHTTP